MKKLFCLAAALCLLLSLTACGESEMTADTEPEAGGTDAVSTEDSNKDGEAPETDTITAVIKVRNRISSSLGTIEVELDR